jgi:hypothetical protein
MAGPSNSRHLRAESKAGLYTVAIALVVTILAGWFTSSQKVAALNGAKLQSYQQSLHSYAAESELLAYQAQHGRAPANFTRESAQKLYEAVSDVRANLQLETPEAGVAGQVKRTQKQASELTDALAQLVRSPDAQQLGQLVSKFDALKQGFPTS